MFHFHKWTHDSQGAIYCQHCRKFRGWMPGEVAIDKSGISIGWGYLLNGDEWREKKEAEIKANGGLYPLQERIPVSEMTSQISNIYSEILNRLVVILKPVTELLLEAYKNAGCPYGDSEEGFTRWLNEVADKVPNYRRQK